MQRNPNVRLFHTSSFDLTVQHSSTPCSTYTKSHLSTHRSLKAFKIQSTVFITEATIHGETVEVGGGDVKPGAKVLWKKNNKY